MFSKLFSKLLRQAGRLAFDTRAAASIEYALVAVLIAIGSLAALTAMANSVIRIWSGVEGDVVESVSGVQEEVTQSISDVQEEMTENISDVRTAEAGAAAPKIGDIKAAGKKGIGKPQGKIWKDKVKGEIWKGTPQGKIGKGTPQGQDELERARK